MKLKALIRHPATWAVLAVGAVVFAVAMYLFQPWRLFTTVRVDEALPVATAPAAPAPDDPAATAAPPAKPKELSKGTFVSHEHDTSGRARVLELPGGEKVLRIEDLDTSDGPDLRVWLSDQPVKKGSAGWFNLDDGKWVELGELKGNKGNANYAIPDSADLDSLRSVTIWCKRFSVSFGAATLA
ncbi:DM13 domain-containing protein [Streptosporangium sp. KLBMP 9127]|nr:DM13 domain-containing protein [Streptosporangium sp. KLBMP 9127]